MDFSKAVRTARSIANISQKELARRASLNRSYISLIESGDRAASLKALEQIAKALNFPMHLLSLLAVEGSDRASLNAEEINALGVSLAKLLLSTREDEDKANREQTANVGDSEPE